MTSHPARPHLLRLRRRIVSARFFEGAVTALWMSIALCGVVYLGARVTTSTAEWLQQPPWLIAGLSVLGVSLLAGTIHAARSDWNEGRLALRIDRHLGLGALLVAGLERDTGSWSAELQRRVAAASNADSLAQYTPSRWLWRGAAALAFAGLLACLPPPPPEAIRKDPLLLTELERIEEELELALAAGTVDEEEGDALERSLQELRDALNHGGDVDWMDIDRLAERLDHDESVRLDRLESMQAALAEFARAADHSADSAHQQLAAAVEQAAELGLAEELPAELQKMLETLAEESGGAPDAAGEPGAKVNQAGQLRPGGLDPDQMKRLAEALGKAGKGQLGKMRRLGKIDPAKLLDLQKLLEEGQGQAQGQGQGQEPGQGQGQGQGQGRQGPGAGGLDRGRGDATLRLTNESDTDTSKLDVTRLPPGIAAPDEWSIVGLRRASPEVDPNRDSTVGGTGSTSGSGGEATWRRRVAPRHRDAVRRFFTSRGKQPPR